MTSVKVVANLGNKSCAHLAGLDHVAVDLVLIFDFSTIKVLTSDFFVDLWKFFLNLWNKSSAHLAGVDHVAVD